MLRVKSKSVVPDCAALVQSVAEGDQRALHALCERAHPAVLMPTLRVTANREMAEELTIDVSPDIGRPASRCDPADGGVLGWIDERKLLPGNYNYGPLGTSGHQIWSETGCTGALLTSAHDFLR